MNKKGFTLIELLVVVLIIGILAAIALPMYTKTVEKSRAVNATVWVKTTGDSLQRYFFENPSADSAISQEDLDIEPAQNIKGFNCYLGDFNYNMQGLFARCQSTTKDYSIYFDAYADGAVQGPYCSGEEGEMGEQMCKMLGYTSKMDTDNSTQKCGGDENDSNYGYCWVKP